MAGAGHRRSIRLQGFDYGRPGLYFVTIVTIDRLLLFGDVKDGHMELSALGEIAQAEWLRSPSVRSEMELDAFVVMPNHVHGIVGIVGADGNGGMPPSPRTGANVPTDRHGRPLVSRSLGAFIRGYKSAVTQAVNAVRDTPGGRVWQRNYYEHVIRDEQALNQIRRYIRLNPVRWEYDPENREGSPDAWERSFWRRAGKFPASVH